MKNLIVGLLIFMPLQIVSGQDKIITIQKDTILCRIVSVSSTHIQYEKKVEKQIVGNFIPIEQVLEYYRGVSSPEIRTIPRNEKPSRKPARRWLIDASAGVAQLVASTADSEKEMKNMGIPKSQIDSYIKQYQQGWSFNGEMYYLFFDFLGVGGKYSLFTSLADMELTAKYPVYPLTEYDNLVLGSRERQYIHYAGPSVMFRQWLDRNRKIQLMETVSVGYVYYRNESRLSSSAIISHALIEGRTIGASSGISASYYPINCLSIGLKATYMYGFFTKIKYATKNYNETIKFDNWSDYEHIPRFDFLINMQFHF